MMTDQQESEATQFAMELLMPVPMVEKYLKAHGLFDICDDKPVKDMAKHFQVPTTIMAMRLCQLHAENRNKS